MGEGVGRDEGAPEGGGGGGQGRGRVGEVFFCEGAEVGICGGVGEEGLQLRVRSQSRFVGAEGGGGVG